MLTASCFTLDHTEKSDSIFLTLFPSYIYTHHRLLQAAESQLSQPLLTLQILQALNHIHISFLDSLQYIHVLLLNGESKLTILHQMCLTCAEGQITSITFLKLSLMQPRRVLISCCSGTSLAHSQLQLSAPFLQVSEPVSQAKAQTAEHQPCTVPYQLQALSFFLCIH